MRPLGAFFRVQKRGTLLHERRILSYNHLDMQRLVNYLKDTRAEFRHVSWPTGRQAIVYSVLIIALSVVVSLFLGLFDFLFTWVLHWFIGLSQ